MNVWVCVRFGLVAALFIAVFLGKDEGVDAGLPYPYLAAVMFAFGVLSMFFVIGIQFVNSRSDAVWTFPRWTDNPFSLGQPLQFFHFAGHGFLAGGLGSLLRATSADAPRLLQGQGVILTSVGAGVLAGTWCCTRVFRKKMAPRA